MDRWLPERWTKNRSVKHLINCNLPITYRCHSWSTRRTFVLCCANTFHSAHVRGVMTHKRLVSACGMLCMHAFMLCCVRIVSWVFKLMFLLYFFRFFLNSSAQRSQSHNIHTYVVKCVKRMMLLLMLGLALLAVCLCCACAQFRLDCEMVLELQTAA